MGCRWLSKAVEACQVAVKAVTGWRRGVRGVEMAQSGVNTGWKWGWDGVWMGGIWGTGGLSEPKLEA